MVGPAHDGETDDAEHGIEGDAEAALVVFVAEPAGGEHYDAGEGVGRGDEALGGAGVVAEFEVEDYGEEVSESVGDGCCAAETWGEGVSK